MKIQTIIPTAGTGTRLKADCTKPMVELLGKPLCVYALEAFQKSPVVDSVILVGHKDKLGEFENIIKQYGLTKIKQVVAGGETRCESVASGLNVLDDDTDIVIVHDGARPLVSLETIKQLVSICQQSDAVVSAVPVKPTIKRVNKDSLIVEETLLRDNLWEIQTPQVFKKDVLLKAHQENTSSSPTDDAVMVEQLGIKVQVCPGDYKNIKITTQEDLVIAEAFLLQNSDIGIKK